MMIEIIRAKIHNATITKKELNYAGSIGIDKVLLSKSGILENEKVQVVNANNGSRLETYVIAEKGNSGTIALYGPAARQAEVGDKICIMSYALAQENEAKPIKPQIIIVDNSNKVNK
ncbi:MAG: aspartate 1-decarboxylase [bacterium]|nr:aspartate 1-decarboxylase [bacterium]MDD5756604.1 aspartate 1-decarboxylase [bacterium]